MGLRCVVYIDNGILAASSEQECMAGVSQIVSDLEHAGFVLNIIKSQLTPQQIGQWLGFILNLIDGTFAVPEDKVARLMASIQSILASLLVHVRCLASAVGQIISMSLAVGPVTCLRTRALYATIIRCHSWADRLPLSAEAWEELQFWRECLFNGRPYLVFP